jgi:hypothetical protein
MPIGEIGDAFQNWSMALDDEGLILLVAGYTSIALLWLFYCGHRIRSLNRELREFDQSKKITIAPRQTIVAPTQQVADSTAVATSPGPTSDDLTAAGPGYIRLRENGSSAR